MTPELQKKCIDSIRFLCVDAVEKANSGHPGICLDAAPMAFVMENALSDWPTAP